MQRRNGCAQAARTDSPSRYTLYRDILGTAPVHVHASAHVEPDPAHLPKARRTIQHIYAKDYAMLRDFDLM